MSEQMTEITQVACRWCPPGCRSCEPDDCECYTHQGEPDSALNAPCAWCREPASNCPNSEGECCCLPCYERVGHVATPPAQWEDGCQCSVDVLNATGCVCGVGTPPGASS